MEPHERRQYQVELLRLLTRGENEIKAEKGYDFDRIFTAAFLSALFP